VKRSQVSNSLLRRDFSEASTELNVHVATSFSRLQKRDVKTNQVRRQETVWHSCFFRSRAESIPGVGWA